MRKSTTIYNVPGGVGHLRLVVWEMVGRRIALIEQFAIWQVGSVRWECIYNVCLSKNNQASNNNQPKPHASAENKALTPLLFYDLLQTNSQVKRGISKKRHVGKVDSG